MNFGRAATHRVDPGDRSGSSRIGQAKTRERWKCGKSRRSHGHADRNFLASLESVRVDILKVSEVSDSVVLYVTLKYGWRNVL